MQNNIWKPNGFLIISWFARFKHRFGKLENRSKKILEQMMQKSLKHHQKSDQKWSQKPLKNHPKIDVEKSWFLDRFFRIFSKLRGSLRVPNLPSVRKVNCRKTNKRKKNRRKRNNAGKETLLSNPNTPLGRGAGPGRISVACGNYPPWACKDRCMRKSGAVQRKSFLRLVCRCFAEADA